MGGHKFIGPRPKSNNYAKPKNIGSGGKGQSKEDTGSWYDWDTLAIGIEVYIAGYSPPSLLSFIRYCILSGEERDLHHSISEVIILLKITSFLSVVCHN